MCLAELPMGEPLHVPINEQVPVAYGYTTATGYGDVNTSAWPHPEPDKCVSSSPGGHQTTRASRLSKADDPLDDPQVNGALQRLQVSGDELISMSVKELNKRLADCPNIIVAKLKRCRRTVKNRGYAKNCRTKRIEIRDELLRENHRLSRENQELRQSNRSLLFQLNERRQDHTSCLSVGLPASAMKQHPIAPYRMQANTTTCTTTACQIDNNNLQFHPQATTGFSEHSSEAEHLADMIVESMVSDETIPQFTHVRV